MLNCIMTHLVLVIPINPISTITPMTTPTQTIQDAPPKKNSNNMILKIFLFNNFK